MNKDCKITFSDGREPYEFSSETSLALVLKTAKERNWPILAIETPWYTLSVFDPEVYKTALLFGEGKLQ